MTEHDWQPIRSYDLTVESESLRLAQKLFVRYLEDRVESNEKARTRLIAGIQVALDHARISGARQPMTVEYPVSQEEMRSALEAAVQDAGSQKAWATANNVSEQYVCDCLKGRRDIGVSISRAFGYEPITVYVRVTEKSGIRAQLHQVPL